MAPRPSVNVLHQMHALSLLPDIRPGIGFIALASCLQRPTEPLCNVPTRDGTGGTASESLYKIQHRQRVNGSSKSHRSAGQSAKSTPVHGIGVIVSRVPRAYERLIKRIHWNP